MAYGQQLAALGDFHIRDLEVTSEVIQGQVIADSESLLAVPISVPK